MVNAVAMIKPFRTTKLPAQLSRNQCSNRYFTTEAWFENLTTLREIEGQRSQSSEYFIIEDSLLRVLRASAVNTVLRVSPAGCPQEH